MLISAKAEYGCQALLVLASRYEQSGPVRLGDITKQYTIPARFLVQILLQLKGAGIVITTRGAAGGYQLAKPPTEIKLSEVFQAIEGAEQPRVLREQSLPSDASPSAVALFQTWTKIDHAFQQFLRQRADILASTTLAQLIAGEQSAQYSI